MALLRTLSAYFRECYGCRIHKIAVDAGFTCPNRDGAKGTGGCAFCDGAGSRAPYCDPSLGVREQVIAGIERFSRKVKAERFIVYFQAFSGTYAAPEILRARYEEALCDPRIIGLSVATRSDCLSDEALSIVASYMGRLDEVRLEFGLQTCNLDVLEAMGCSHTPKDFARATRAAHARGIKVTAHLIFGLPGDTPGCVLACADMINSLGVEGVKLHNLYLTPDSRLGRQYLEKPFPIMGREEYIGHVCEFIARLRPEVVIERVAGDTPPGRMLAPDWRLEKHEQWQVIEAELSRRGMRQGSKMAGNKCPAADSLSSIPQTDNPAGNIAQ